LCTINQLPVGDSEQNNRDALHLARHDNGSTYAVTSSNSVRSMPVFIACN
jgi:hypothetical protein